MNLENRFFYRLIKVTYMLCFTLFLLISADIFYSDIPSKIVNNEKSYVSCIRGKGINYSFQMVDVYVRTGSDRLDQYNDLKAIKFCHQHLLRPKQNPDIENSSHLVNLFDELKIEPYDLKLTYKADWAGILDLFGFHCILLIIFYLAMNVIKETLIYLAFGRKFSWGRLYSIRIF